MCAETEGIWGLLCLSVFYVEISTYHFDIFVETESIQTHIHKNTDILPVQMYIMTVQNAAITHTVLDRFLSE